MITRMLYARRLCWSARFFFLGYGTSLNLAPVEFRHVVGLYIATLFVVWQFINFIFFRTLANLPIFVGGAFIYDWRTTGNVLETWLFAVTATVRKFAP